MLTSIPNVDISEPCPRFEDVALRLSQALQDAEARGVAVIKIIHGYNPHRGEDIFQVTVRSWLSGLVKGGVIRGYIPGENWSTLDQATWSLQEEYSELLDTELDQSNAGLTVVWLWVPKTVPLDEAFWPDDAAELYDGLLCDCKGYLDYCPDCDLLTCAYCGEGCACLEKEWIDEDDIASPDSEDEDEMGFESHEKSEALRVEIPEQVSPPEMRKVDEPPSPNIIGEMSSAGRGEGLPVRPIAPIPIVEEREDERKTDPPWWKDDSIPKVDEVPPSTAPPLPRPRPAPRPKSIPSTKRIRRLPVPLPPKEPWLSKQDKWFLLIAAVLVVPLLVGLLIIILKHVLSSG